MYLYRDVLPLGTFFGIPQDSLDGTLLMKIALLGLTGLLIPLLAPRKYEPVDPTVGFGHLLEWSLISV